MRAAVKALVTMARSGPDRRRTFAVLGEMAELGDDAVVAHDAIGRLAVRLDVTRIIAVGAPPGRSGVCSRRRDGRIVG